MSARKYPCGNDKRKKKRKQEQLTQALSGSLNKYFTSSKSSESETISIENLVREEVVNVNPNDPMDIVDHEEREEANTDIPPAQEHHVEPLDIYDPNNWKSVDHNLIDFLVERGPIRVEMEESEYPRDDSHNKRHFSNVHYTRRLPNGEKQDRRWLVYSKSSDKVFCFCCKLFKGKKGDSRLITTGFRNWHSIGSRLKQHESSSEHIMCMNKWIDLEIRLRRNQTIDKVVQERIMVEKEHNRQVFIRVMGAIKCLVKNNLAYSGFSKNGDEEDNEMFLGLIEMVAGFDPVMQVYLERLESKEIQYDYLSHEAQIELIQLLANEVKSAVLEKIKKAKYFSVILDCTRDESHEEQAALLIRCVNEYDFPVKVVEYFLGFFKVDDTTGTGLFLELENALSVLGLNIQDIRGQAYGNGVNVKGHRKCIQSRLLSINPRAFYAPHDCHNLNLAFCDMANSSPKARSYFGSVQCLYKVFSSSTKWWDILKRHVNDLTLEPLSHTRWESHIESVKTIKYNALKIRDALFDLVSSGDPLTSCQAESLATHEFGSFEFVVSTIIWYEVLNAVSTVSKTFQSEDLQIDVAIDQLKGLIARLREYKEHGFRDALLEAQELAREMDIEPVFCERTHIHKKTHFDDEDSSEEAMCSPQESFRSEYFLYIVEKALTSFNEILELLCAYERNFGFLFDLKKCTDDTSLKSSCENLSNILSHNGQVDLDVNELFMELKFVRHVLPSEIGGPIQVLNYLKKCYGGYPNTEIAYRILLAVPVTVPSGQRSCSKLELVKNYLQSTMSEECLNELAMISLENDMVEKIDYSTLFNKFASKRVRRPTFK